MSLEIVEIGCFIVYNKKNKAYYLIGSIKGVFEVPLDWIQLKEKYSRETK